MSEQEGNENNNSCNLQQFKRNLYFYGKLMSVKDFEDEQKYMNGKRLLVNRFVHGPGIIRGFGELALKNTGGNIEIEFTKGGVAFDCCGNEIVVPDGKVRPVKLGAEKLTAGTLAGGQYYLYLEYSDFDAEPVPTAANASSCDEKCCNSRRVEDFEVIASTVPPDSDTIDCTEIPAEYHTKEKLREWINQQINSLPSCDDRRVFLVAITKNRSISTKDSDFVDIDETLKYRAIVYNNQLLSDLLRCHITADNPHKLGLEVEEAEEAEGEKVEFSNGIITIEKNDAITLDADTENHKITIGETHSARTDNPHGVTAGQVEALTSVDGVSNPGGNVDLVAQNSITITPDPVALAVVIGETHSGYSGNPHQTEHAQLENVLEVNPGDVEDDNADKHISNQHARKWNNAVFTISGRQPDNNGEISVEAGDNITISTQDNKITINSTGGGADCFTGKVIFEGVTPGGEYISPPIKLDMAITGLPPAVNLAAQYMGQLPDTPDKKEIESVIDKEIVREKNDASMYYYLGIGEVSLNLYIILRTGISFNWLGKDFIVRYWITMPSQHLDTVTVIPPIPTPTFTIPTPTFTLPTPTLTIPTITIPTLTVTSPTLTIPTITKPTLTIPTFTVTSPTLTIPTVTKPTLTIPTFTVTSPTLTIPTVTKPTLTIPTLTVTSPTLTIPTVTKPTLTIPTLTVTSPTLTIPTVTKPTLTIPTFTVTSPTLTIPTVTKPTLTIPTFTVTSPTLTIPTVTKPTLTIPTLTVTSPTLTIPTVTKPTLTIPTFTVTSPTLTIPTVTKPTLTIPTFTVTGPTLVKSTAAAETMPKTPKPTVITPGAGYLTDIPGIGTATAKKLNAGGITSVAELAAASPDRVAEILGSSDTARANALIEEAKERMR